MQPHSVRDQAIIGFRERFGAQPPWLVRSPGRVNLIGEHTDYNEGFVLPMAIDRSTWIALKPRHDRRVRLHSAHGGQSVDLDLDRLQRGEGWGEYVKGMAWALEGSGRHLKGWDGCTATDIPMGAGLSSSAAFELALARCFALASGLSWEPRAMALLACRAENEWVGMKCGVMDQLIVALGRENEAMLIDCRDLSVSPASLPCGTSIVVLDTGTRRGLVGSAYNERRAQCRAASSFFGLESLRHLSEERLAAASAALDPTVFRRARHVVTENVRTRQAFEALCANDASRLGALMNLSHESLRGDFEVSTPELDAMVDAARAGQACYGARMTGAGFGGCSIALVASHSIDPWLRTVHERYTAATDRTMTAHPCRAAGGTELQAP